MDAELKELWPGPLTFAQMRNIFGKAASDISRRGRHLGLVSRHQARAADPGAIDQTLDRVQYEIHRTGAGGLSTVEIAASLGLTERRALELCNLLAEAGRAHAKAGHGRLRHDRFWFPGRAANGRAASAAPAPAAGPNERALRRCLGGCGSEFMSEWNGNRICESCKGVGALRGAAGLVSFVEPASSPRSRGGRRRSAE